MDLNTEIKDRHIIIAKPSGKIDATNADDFTNSLLNLFNENKNVILDFSAIDYISSAGLRSILIAAKNAKSSNVKFVLCCLQEQIYEIFQMTGFTQMLSIFNTFEEAENIVKS